MDLLKALCQTPGTSGREHRVRDLILQKIKPLVDEIRTDPMGNVLCKRNPRPAATKKSRDAKHQKPLKIMLAAHMDQIGFLVKHIDDKGFLRLNPVGGFDARNLFARLVTVCTDDGDITGVLNPGGKPIHIASEEEKKKIPEIQDFLVDLALPPDEIKKRVKIGDPVVLQAPFTLIGKSVVAQCLDNRLACWLVIRALEQLKNHDAEIHAVFTVQEEVGLRGAQTSAYEIKPDIGIGIDSTLAVDTPGVPEDLRVTIFGGGAAITVMDSSVISDAALVAEFESLAKKHNIKHQRSILPRGGTDTAALQRAAAGCRAITLSCPVRYIHTVTEMLHQEDLFACRDLLVAYLAQAK
jgi:endoglucanase